MQLAPEQMAQALTPLGITALIFGLGAVISLRQTLYSSHDPNVRRKSRNWLIAITLIMAFVAIGSFGMALWLQFHGS